MELWAEIQRKMIDYLNNFKVSTIEHLNSESLLSDVTEECGTLFLMDVFSEHSRGM